MPPDPKPIPLPEANVETLDDLTDFDGMGEFILSCVKGNLLCAA
jgi:hypothetical protein